MISASIDLVPRVRCRSCAVELADYRVAIERDLSTSTGLSSIASSLKNLSRLKRNRSQRVGQYVVHCRSLATVWANNLAADRTPVARSVDRPPRWAPESAILAEAAHQRFMRSA